MNQMGKVKTANKFVKAYGGRWGFDGSDMCIFLKTKKAVAEAKREIPRGLICKENIDGKNETIIRF
jgi:hypothetical protein